MTDSLSVMRMMAKTTTTKTTTTPSVHDDEEENVKEEPQGKHGHNDDDEEDQEELNHPAVMQDQSTLSSSTSSTGTTSSSVCRHVSSSSTSSSSSTTTTPYNNNNNMIGGPNTSIWLPFVIESSLCWIFALCCLSVSFWYYMKVQLLIRISTTTTTRRREKQQRLKQQQQQQQQQQHGIKITNLSLSSYHLRLLDVPLMTHSRRELDTISTFNGWLYRYEQLALRLECIQPIDVWVQPTDYRSGIQLTQYIRTHETIRRLVSLLMRRKEYMMGVVPTDTTTITTTAYHTTTLSQVLIEIWPKLIELPTTHHTDEVEDIITTSTSTNSTTTDTATTVFDISVVLPAYQESGYELSYKLRQAITCASNPTTIEVIIVNVGYTCTDMDVLIDTVQYLTSSSSSSSKSSSSPSTKTPSESPNGDGCGNNGDDINHDCHMNGISNGSNGTARSNNKNDTSNKRNGQCDNYGCYDDGIQDNHPPRTDHQVDGPKISIVNYGGGGGRGPCLNYGAKLAKGTILTFLHADTRLTPNWDVAVLNAFRQDNNNINNNNKKKKNNSCAFSFGIDTSSKAIQSGGGYYPPGICAIEVTANIRTHLFRLPYGDQCLSVPKVIFDYLGGYPDQCLMEDYDLISLLRQRVAVLHDEHIEILSQKAYCSPRRWQKYGVLYVTYMNSKCVNLYSRGDITPDELFCKYYGTTVAPARQYEKSPWELQLELELDKGE